MADNENIEINIDEQNDDVRFGVNDSIIEAVSPTAVVSKSGDTATITITDKNGTTSASISDGQDGISPTATVSKSGDTTTITIIDKNGTTTAEVYDGASDAVNDVKIDGSSIVDSSDNVAYIPKATGTGFGVMKAVVGAFSPVLPYLSLGFEQNDSDISVRVPEFNSSTNKLYPDNLPDATQSAKGAMTATDKTKLDGITSGAEPNVQADWNETDSTSDAYIKNKPNVVGGITSISGTAPINVSGTSSSKNVSVSTFSNATETSDGTSGVVPAPTAGMNGANIRFLDSSAGQWGLITLTDSNANTIGVWSEPGGHIKRLTVSDFTGATATTNGTSGLVPAPMSDSMAEKFVLASSGDWRELGFDVVGSIYGGVEFDFNIGNATISDTLSNATTTSNGAMSSTDKTKLNGITAGAEPNRTYTAVTGKPTGNQTPSFGSTFTVSQISQDATGQLTATDRTVKIPSTQASASTAGLMSSASYNELERIYVDGRMDFETDYSTVDYNLYQAIDALGWTSEVID